MHVLHITTAFCVLVLGIAYKSVDKMLNRKIYAS